MTLSQYSPLERHPFTNEPFIRLPPPYDRIIITPARREDIPHMVISMNDDRVKRWLDGPTFPYMDADAEEWIRRSKEVSDMVMRELRLADEECADGPLQAVSGCPVGSLRGVEEDGTEVFLGAIEFSRCSFPDMMDHAEQERLVTINESRKSGDPGIVWCAGYFLAGALHGRGLMTCALRTLLETWVLPRMGARQIRAETIIGNQGCIRVLEKLGFRITESVRRRKVTSAGELIEGFHVLWWRMDVAVAA